MKTLLNSSKEFDERQLKESFKNVKIREDNSKINNS